MVNFLRLFAFFSIAALLSACASQPPAKSDYSARAASSRAPSWLCPR